MITPQKVLEIPASFRLGILEQNVVDNSYTQHVVTTAQPTPEPNTTGSHAAAIPPPTLTVHSPGGFAVLEPIGGLTLEGEWRCVGRH